MPRLPTLGAIALLAAAGALSGCRSEKEKAEYEAKRAAHVAALEAKEKADNDEIQAACKSKDVTMPDKSRIVRACEDAVTQRVGNGADFPLLRNDPERDGCDFRLDGSYSGTNGLGAKVERGFRCTYNAKTGVARVAL